MKIPRQKYDAFACSFRSAFPTDALMMREFLTYNSAKLHTEMIKMPVKHSPENENGQICWPDEQDTGEECENSRGMMNLANA